MPPPLQLRRSFYKAHGHGNDYLVFEEGLGWPVTPKSVRAVCHRQKGVGGDGIVALLAPVGGSGGGSFRARMFNPDGSEFERSGNGLRILGAYLHSQDRVREGEPFRVEVGGGVVTMEILGQELDGELPVAVDMGEARFGMAAVGGREGELARGPAGELLDFQPVSVGNPHCVVFRDSVDERDLLELGPFLTAHPVFSAGVNVQLASVVDPGEVRILIWERGVGRTASSGTSACAVASACVHKGRLPPGAIEVVMEGGSFMVTVSSHMGVKLEGPVQTVLRGELSQGLADLFG